LNVLISGSSGLIGSALAERLAADGHAVGRLLRPPREPNAGDALWDPAAGMVDVGALEGRDAVVHLAGENIGRRWSRKIIARIRDSRVGGTRLLCDALARLDEPPDVLLTASGIGLYGSRGEEALDEASAMGEGFMADLCRDWEAAAAPAAEAGIRVVNLRLALVLSAAGGALKRMLRPFRLGLGGRVGSGRQYWSWVTLTDAVAAFAFALTSPGLSGPVNVASPKAVTSREFTAALGRVLHRPTFLPAPAWGVRLAFGKMADELLLASARVLPKKLLEAGFTFRQADLEPALRQILT